MSNSYPSEHECRSTKLCGRRRFNVTAYSHYDKPSTATIQCTLISMWMNIQGVLTSYYVVDLLVKIILIGH